MKKLSIATLLFIAAPTFIFLIFWLKPVYALLSASSLVIAFVLAVFHLKNHHDKQKELSLFPSLLSSALLALAICLVSEFGVINYQSFDYQIHNYKLNLLATEELPLYNARRDIYMCYYLGYYAIPGLLGKWFSIGLVKYGFFLWCWIGLSLSFTWIQLRVIHLSHIKRVLMCAALLIGAYVCVLLPALTRLFPNLPVEAGNSLVINDKFILNQIPALTRGLSESPQHTLPAVLGICFLLAVWQKPAFFFALALFFLSTLFLTPFASIGLMPFMLVALIRNLSGEGKAFFQKVAVFAVPLTVAFLPVVLFLSSSEATSMKSNRVIWNAGLPYWFLYYAIYLFTAYGVWFLFFGKQMLRFSKSAVYISIAFMSIISLFQIGYYNDLHIRSTIVPQMVFGISIAYLIVTRFDLIWKKRTLTLGFLFWCVNSMSPVKFFYDRIFVFEGQLNSIEHPEIASMPGDYYDVMEKAYVANGKEVVKQYSMRKGTIFEKYLLKKRLPNMIN